MAIFIPLIKAAVFLIASDLSLLFILAGTSVRVRCRKAGFHLSYFPEPCSQKNPGRS
jgi:hypothetical protein